MAILKELKVGRCFYILQKQSYIDIRGFKKYLWEVPQHACSLPPPLLGFYKSNCGKHLYSVRHVTSSKCSQPFRVILEKAKDSRLKLNLTWVIKIVEQTIMILFVFLHFSDCPTIIKIRLCVFSVSIRKQRSMS